MAETISVAMAVYNGESFLPEQLDSILQQTRRPDEMIIADDCSQDGTREIIDRFRSHAPFPVMILPGEANIGYARNFMRAADRCRGSMILFADQDDVWHPDKIEAMAAVDEAGRAAVISHDVEIWSDSPGRASHASYYALLEERGFTPAVCFKGCSLSVRRDALEAWGWPPPPSTVSHDLWLALLATASGSRTFIRRPLLRHRLHASNASGWIAGISDLVYTPAAQLGSRSDLDVMIETCIKSWRLEWTETFIEAVDRLDPPLGEDRLLAFRTALAANRAHYERRPASDRPPSQVPDGRGPARGGGGPVPGPAPEDVVRRLYGIVLRREVDPEGAAHFSQVIRDTGDPTLVLSALLDSEEYRNLCRREAGRAPPSFDLTPEDVVERLYRVVLRREADPEGAAHFSQLIRDTGDPTLVLSTLMHSEEYRNLHRAGSREESRGETGGAASIRFGHIADLARSHPAAGLPPALDVIVPVFNAAEWLHPICDAYKALEVRPLYIVDAASADDSLAILQRRGERVFTVHNEQKFVEPLLSKVIPYIGSEWVLRLDDDELPTRSTLAWIAQHCRGSSDSAVALPRRWVRASAGRVESCLAADGSWNDDLNVRLFRPGAVRPTAEIHTPGFEVTTMTVAPAEAGILHLDWLVRDEATRRRKVVGYEEHSPGKGWFFKPQYLPETMPRGFYGAQAVVDDVALAACARLLDSLGDHAANRPIFLR